MAWYVFALADEVPMGRLGRGLSGALRARSVAGAYAIVERRADIPPAAFGSLRAHQAVVVRLSEAIPAILPVRFGTLLDESALEEALADRGADLAEAFALVRYRVQFTWRHGPPAGRSQPHRTPAAVISPGPAGTGAAYLRRAAAGTSAAVPASFRLLRDRLHAFVVREKFQPAASGMPDTLYQLINKPAVTRYRVMAEALTLTSPMLTVSGPWPPFAFAPELL
ncbi:MAG TPA: GvpL/GvpF family gas vesicle protein [Vicinamibacterales bacterium]